MEFTSARLRLRPFEDGDLAGYAELLSDPEAHPFIVEGGPLPAAEAAARLDALRAATSSTHWALEFEGAFVGYVALHDHDAPSPALSFALRSAWRRRGLALEALEAVARAFPHQELVARTQAENAPSAALLLRAGFREAGSVECAQGPRREFRRAAAAPAARSAPPSRSPLASGVALAGFVIACFSAAALGALSPPDAWYADLIKPSWNPPGWVFGPVWTLLYLAMAWAGWRIWRLPQRRAPLALFGLQLVLNAAWSPLFFGLHAPGLALVEILALWVAIAATGVCFYRRDRLAGLLFAPYFAWVSFAALLNATLWRLNAP